MRDGAQPTDAGIGSAAERCVRWQLELERCGARMKNLLVWAALGAVAFAGIAEGSDALAAGTGQTRYVCTGGQIPSGTYSSVSVTGICEVSGGSVTVTGNVMVAPGALLDATTPGSSGLPGQVVVGGNVIVGAGAVLFLGCDKSILCSSGSTFGSDKVGGSVIASGALGVDIHAVTVNGSISMVGGGGGPAMLTGGPGSGACFGLTGSSAPAPWSEDPGPLSTFPVYSDVEDSTIGGNLRIIGMETCYIGALRNSVGGNILDQNNLMGDPDANEVVNNMVQGNIVCTGSDPTVQFGDSGAAPNLVGGEAIGQCGFTVEQPDPNYSSGGLQPISLPSA